MNHKKVYESIIFRAKSKNRVKLKKSNPAYIYYENHHIIPSCLNGSNEKENKVLLTAKEHYLCHKLLTYIHKGNIKIGCAFYRMTFDKKSKHKISSRDYAYAKEVYSDRNMYGENNPMHGKSFYDVWLKKYGEDVANEKYNDWHNHKKENSYGHIPWNKDKSGCFSEETIQKLSAASKGENNGMHGKHHNAETIKKMKNRVFSEEHKQKLKNNRANIWGENNPSYNIRYINDRVSVKRVKIEELDYWINLGWIRGKKIKKGIN